MSDPSLTASMLELGAQIAELRDAMPKAPATDLSRSEFFKLAPSEQMEFIRRSGRIHDDPPTARPKPTPGSVSRQEFDSWGADKRHGHIKAGRAVHD